MPFPFIKAYLRIGTLFGDTASDSDREPDLVWASEGTVILTPKVGNLKFPDENNRRAVAGLAPKVGYIKEGGRIAWEHEDAAVDNDILVVDLTDESIDAGVRITNPDGATYTLRLQNVRANGQTVFARDTFDVRIAPNVADENDVVNLADQIPPTASAPIVVDLRKGDPGDPGVGVENLVQDTPGTMRLRLTDDELTDPITLPPSTVPDEAGLAAAMKLPAVRGEVTAQIGQEAGPRAAAFQKRAGVAGGRAGGIVNHVANPRLATSATSWATNGFGTGGAGTAARVADAWGSGEHAWVTTWTTAATGGSANMGPYSSERTPVTPGETLMPSIDAEASAAVILRETIAYYTAASGGSPTTLDVFDVPVAANKRTRLSPDRASVVPAGATHAAVYVRLDDASTIGTGTIKVGRASITRGRNLKPYRDAVVTGSSRSGFLAAEGDSMVQGSHGGGSTFPDLLATDLGVQVLNRGRGGEASYGIALRDAAIQPLVTFPSNQIPASGSATVTLSPTGYLHTTASWVYYGSVGGVEGTLTRNSGGTTWTFARAVAGSAVDLPPGGTPFSARTTVDYADAKIIWTGANDIDSGTVDGVLNANGAIVDRSRANGQPFVVLSVLNPSYGPSGSAKHTFVTNVNAALAARYGSAFLDVRRYLIDEGLAAAGISPTSGDTTAISEDRIPPSLMADDIHLNNAGRTVVAKYVAQFLGAHVLGPVPATETQSGGTVDLSAYDAQLTPLRAGFYYAGVAGGVATGMTAEGSLRGSRLIVGRSCTLDTIAFEVTTAGSAGALFRVGLYLYDAASNSATLLVDGGAVDATTTGVKTVTVSQAVTKGQTLLLAGVTQGGATTRPTVRVNGGFDPTVGDPSAGTVLGNAASGFTLAAGVSGALPASPGGFGLSANNGCPRLAVKAA